MTQNPRLSPRWGLFVRENHGAFCDNGMVIQGARWLPVSALKEEDAASPSAQKKLIKCIERPPLFIPRVGHRRSPWKVAQLPCSPPLCPGLSLAPVPPLWPPPFTVVSPWPPWAVRHTVDLFPAPPHMLTRPDTTLKRLLDQGERALWERLPHNLCIFVYSCLPPAAPAPGGSSTGTHLHLSLSPVPQRHTVVKRILQGICPGVESPRRLLKRH